jgi:hypothetical protein
LVVSLLVVVGEILVDRGTQVVLTEEHELAEALAMCVELC